MDMWLRRKGGIPHYIPRLPITEEYIRWLDITEEFTFIFLGTDEYRGIYLSTLYSPVSIMKVCSSVITDEQSCVSCSVESLCESSSSFGSLKRHMIISYSLIIRLCKSGP
jgi:hypothetical protein